MREVSQEGEVSLPCDSVTKGEGTVPARTRGGVGGAMGRFAFLRTLDRALAWDGEAEGDGVRVGTGEGNLLVYSKRESLDQEGLWGQTFSIYGVSTKMENLGFLLGLGAFHAFSVFMLQLKLVGALSSQWAGF